MDLVERLEARGSHPATACLIAESFKGRYEEAKHPRGRAGKWVARLDTVDPGSLPKVPGIKTRVVNPHGPPGGGHPEVEVTGSHPAIKHYVDKHWGPGTFADHVEIGAAKPVGTPTTPTGTKSPGSGLPWDHPSHAGGKRWDEMKSKATLDRNYKNVDQQLQRMTTRPDPRDTTPAAQKQRYADVHRGKLAAARKEYDRRGLSPPSTAALGRFSVSGTKSPAKSKSGFAPLGVARPGEGKPTKLGTAKPGQGKPMFVGHLDDAIKRTRGRSREDLVAAREHLRAGRIGQAADHTHSAAHNHPRDHPASLAHAGIVAHLKEHQGHLPRTTSVSAAHAEFKQNSDAAGLRGSNRSMVTNARMHGKLFGDARDQGHGFVESQVHAGKVMAQIRTKSGAPRKNPPTGTKSPGVPRQDLPVPRAPAKGQVAPRPSRKSGGHPAGPTLSDGSIRGAPVRRPPSAPAAGWLEASRSAAAERRKRIGPPPAIYRRGKRVA